MESPARCAPLIMMMRNARRAPACAISSPTTGIPGCPGAGRWRWAWPTTGASCAPAATAAATWGSPAVDAARTPAPACPGAPIPQPRHRLIFRHSRPIPSFPRKRESTPTPSDTPGLTGVLDSGLRRNDGGAAADGNDAGPAAEAGVWIPAFAGMTVGMAGMTAGRVHRGGNDGGDGGNDGRPRPPGPESRRLASIAGWNFGFLLNFGIAVFRPLQDCEKWCILGHRNLLPGGLSEAAPPVPIPNTEVKRLSADDTARVTGWENRSPPGGTTPTTLRPGRALRRPGRPEPGFIRPQRSFTPARPARYNPGGRAVYAASPRRRQRPAFQRPVSTAGFPPRRAARPQSVGDDAPVDLAGGLTGMVFGR